MEEGGGPEITSAFLRLAMRQIIEQALEAEVSDTVGREFYQRGPRDPGNPDEPGPSGYRNGYRPGRLKTAEGAVAYAAPQVSDREQPFASSIRRQLSGRSDELARLAVEMYARGLSTRDIEDAFRDDQGRSLLSRSAVSEVTEQLWAQYEAFATRDLSDLRLVYLFLDGVAERLRPGERREAVLCAWGIDEEGQKHLLHLAPGTKEDTDSVTAFLQDMKRRGLRDPLLSSTDGAGGLIKAVEQCLPRSLRQRCLAHKMRNLAAKVPDDRWSEFRSHARSCYEAPSPEVARVLRDGVIKRYQKDLPAAIACFLDDFEACIAQLRFPVTHRKAIRTTNLLERLLEEDRRRTKVMPHAFGERPLMKVMYAAVIRASSKWRKLKMTAFERQQLTMIREELNQEFTHHHRPAAKTASPSRFSSNVGT
jgi:transposase-like protein